MVNFVALLAAGAVIGCRQKRSASKMQPTGSDDRSTLAPAHWEVVRGGDDAFIVARGSDVAVIDRAGNNSAE